MDVYLTGVHLTSVYLKACTTSTLQLCILWACILRALYSYESSTKVDADHSERSCQAVQMGRMYRQAEEVPMWLGLGSTEWSPEIGAIKLLLSGDENFISTTTSTTTSTRASSGLIVSGDSLLRIKNIYGRHSQGGFSDSGGRVCSPFLQLPAEL